MARCRTRQLFRRCAAQRLGVGDLDIGDFAPDRLNGETASVGFHVWQFRHPSSEACGQTQASPNRKHRALTGVNARTSPHGHDRDRQGDDTANEGAPQAGTAKRTTEKTTTENASAIRKSPALPKPNEEKGPRSWKSSGSGSSSSCSSSWWPPGPHGPIRGTSGSTVGPERGVTCPAARRAQSRSSYCCSSGWGCSRSRGRGMRYLAKEGRRAWVRGPSRTGRPDYPVRSFHHGFASARAR